MSEFDAYHKWFGIPEEEQPPNHYRLLGIDLYESDVDVIESAAEQRMTFLRSHSNGQRMLIAQRLLNEVAAARLCLSHSDRRAEYDTRLQGRVVVQTEETSSPSGGVQIDVTTTSPRQPSPRKPQARRKALPMPVIGIAATILLVGAVALTFLLTSGRGDKEEEVPPKNDPARLTKKSRKGGNKKQGANKERTKKGKRADKKKSGKRNGTKGKSLILDPLLLDDERQQPLSTRGLISHFPFDDEGDVPFYDAMNRARRPKFSGAAQWSIGRIGGAFELAPGRQLEFNLLRSVPRIGYCLWLCLHSDAHMTIISQPTGTDDKVIRGHRLEVKAGKFTCQFADRFPQTLRVNALKAVKMHRWYHVAVTYNGGRGIRALQMYVNGRPWPTVISHQNLPQSPGVIPRWRVGQANGEQQFHGAIDELRFYGYALRPADVKKIANNRFEHAKSLNLAKKQSLLELKPSKVAVEGSWNSGPKFSLRGVKLDKLVWAKPKSSGEHVSAITFPVSAGTKKILGGAALGDGTADAAKVTFSIVAGETVLWKSRVLKGPGQSHRFKLELKQSVPELTFKVDSSDPEVESFWVNPQLVE